jgi:MFS family permease
MNRRGWIVVLAGAGLNLALGILYAWSVFSKQIVEAVDKGGFGWSKTAATIPYTIAIATFALMMVPAGRLQDKLGPRIVASAGGVLIGLGLLVASLASAESTWPAIVGFGLLSGTGIGLGYAAANPAAVKWFPPEKKGLITGIVVGGFGIAPVYIAPLSKWLLGEYGIPGAFRILGIAFLFAATLFAQLIRNPEKPAASLKPAVAGAKPKVEATWREMLRSPMFYLYYVQYVCAATAGLMIIGHMARIVAVQSNNAIKTGFVFVALLAIFNASGRIIAGIISDYIGRVVTLAIVCIMQATAMFFFPSFSTVGGFILGAAVVGFSYGACLCIFPAATADQWGTKNMGLNYGILFTGWGLGGVIGPLVAGRVVDTTGNYVGAYNVAGLLVMLAFVLAMFSYIEVSVSAEQRSLTIRLGGQKKQIAA